MDKRKREILALGMLAVLGICVASAMAWYILAAHNWNGAASHIDDLVGSMEGYTVIVYEGVLPKAKTAAATTGKAGGTDKAAKKRAQDESVSLADVVASYREKDATVVTLHLDDLGRYEDPTVISRGGKRFGVCYTPGAYRYVVVRDKVRALTEASCDFNIVIAHRPDIKKGWLRNVDLVVMACEGHVGSGGEAIGSAFFVDSPRTGQVQAIIVSPSGYLTSKTIESL